MNDIQFLTCVVFIVGMMILSKLGSIKNAIENPNKDDELEEEEK